PAPAARQAVRNLIVAPPTLEMPVVRGVQMRGLSDVSQKQAIAELTATWILAIYPGDLDLALSLSDAMRHQTDIYLRENKKSGAHH
ncbi:hypothetical protein NKH09_30725, partial [Mesorhizobium sp. M1339]|uniref:hypothetical protein n=1 Tax=Mesorhizobium sp. M1339 TaxID=2957086 RepID=UPI00333E0CF6